MKRRTVFELSTAEWARAAAAAGLAACAKAADRGRSVAGVDDISDPQATVRMIDRTGGEAVAAATRKKRKSQVA
jgi:hypothetical protein